jgi:hypothetical protein
MKARIAICSLLILALAVPVAASTAASDSAVTIAKKKRKKATYCQKKGKKAKAKLFGRVKSAKFFLYTTKRPTEYMFCSESPKFKGAIAAWDGIKKTSHLRAVKNNCAIFYTEGKPGTSWDSESKELKIIGAKYFRRGSKFAKQTHASTLGFKADTVTLESLSLSKNCVYAAGLVKNGVPTLRVSGIGDFPYQGQVTREIPGATTAELKAIKITVVAAGLVQVTWSQAGVAKTLDYGGES